MVRWVRQKEQLISHMRHIQTIVKLVLMSLWKRGYPSQSVGKVSSRISQNVRNRIQAMEDIPPISIDVCLDYLVACPHSHWLLSIYSLIPELKES